MPRLRNLFYGMAGAAEVMVLERRFLDADSWGFYYGFQNHIGDIIIFSSLLNELCLQRGGKRVFLFGSKKFSWVPSLFASERAILLHYNINPSTWRFLPSTNLVPQIGRISPLFPEWLIGIAGWNGGTILDFYLSYLRLHPRTSPEKMRLPTEDEISLARKFMEDNDLPEGKTVLLYPLAYSVSSLPEEEDGWNTIVSELISAGYTVAVNEEKTTIKQNRTSSMVKKIFPPLNLMRGIALLSGTVVTRRSGIPDLLSGLPIRLIVVHKCESYLSAQSELSFYSQKLIGTSDSVVEVCGGKWWNTVLDNIFSTTNGI